MTDSQPPVPGFLRTAALRLWKNPVVGWMLYSADLQTGGIWLRPSSANEGAHDGRWSLTCPVDAAEWGASVETLERNAIALRAAFAADLADIPAANKKTV